MKDLDAEEILTRMERRSNLLLLPLELIKPAAASSVEEFDMTWLWYLCRNLWWQMLLQRK
jgi:hypothetical protein